MKIAFRSAHPEAFLRRFAERAGFVVTDGKVEVPPALGEGIVRQVRLSERLFLTEMHLRLHEKVEMIREPTTGVPFIPILFYLPERPVQQELDDRSLWIGPDTRHGVFWASPEVRTRYHIPAAVWQTSLTIAVHRDWVRSIYAGDGSDLLIQTIDRQHPFFFVEPLAPAWLEQIERIRTEWGQGRWAHVRLVGRVHLLLAAVFESISGRDPVAPSVRVHGDDVDRLMVLKDWMADHLAEPATTDELAERAGMSAAKLQRLFRAVFGQSVYQHYRVMRMERARRLLRTGRYSVSHVGHLVGYSNLSHFAEAFKAVHGQLPSAVAPGR